MKKFLMATIFLGALMIQISQAAAEDLLYVGDWEGGWKAYLVEESVDWKYNSIFDVVFYCQLKGVSSQGTVKYFDYVFTPINDDSGKKIIGATFRDSSGATGKFYDNDPGVYQVEHKVFQILRMVLSDYLKTVAGLK